MSNALINFKESLSSKPQLVSLEQLQNMNINPNKDSYSSIFRYNDSHKEIVEKTGSVSGIKDVKTNLLVWDFDNKDNFSEARADTITLATRLVQDYHVDPDDIQCYMSGFKGFHVVVQIDREITPDEFKAATTQIARDLKTFDLSVSDPARIIRMPNTKHPKSGLYKIPLHIAEVDEMGCDEIRDVAKKPRLDFKPTNKTIKLPASLFETPKQKKEKIMEVKAKLDPKNDPKVTNPPRGWKPYKWALAQGYFDNGERHNALMVIAATCRGLGYDKETTYYMCKSAFKKQAERMGQEEFSKEELWKNIIEQSVFSDRWEGGQYSPSNNPWLKDYCQRNGFSTDEKEDQPFISLDSLNTQFINYATNFEKNIVRTGIGELDEQWTLSTSTLNGLLGQPGSFKTGMSLEILANSSKNNIKSMMFSMDMGVPLVYAKLAQKMTGQAFKDVLKMFKDDQKRSGEVFERIKHNYANVGFNFKSGLTAPDLKNIIEERNQLIGEPTKLIIIDYLECMAGPYSDPTANAGFIANQLKDVANETGTCILLLLQTQKHSTPDISDPLLSMKQIKGASIIEQACSTVLTLWREGYSPKTTENDKYISFALVKNRFGGLWSSDFMWDPLFGKVNSMTEENREEFEEFKKEKAAKRSAVEGKTWE